MKYLKNVTFSFFFTNLSIIYIFLYITILSCFPLDTGAAVIHLDVQTKAETLQRVYILKILNKMATAEVMWLNFNILSNNKLFQTVDPLSGVTFSKDPLIFYKFD